MVFALGVFRSASTWAANVAVEILRHHAPARLAFGDSVAAILAKAGGGPGAIVAKTHRPDAGLRALIRDDRAPVLLSIRDPADCVASMAEQFGESVANATAGVAQSCERILAVLPDCEPLVLCYEAPHAREVATLRAMAVHLGVAPPEHELERLAARFAHGEVRRMIDGFTADGIFGPDPRPNRFHPSTHWHYNHLGRGDAGRARLTLTPVEILVIERLTRPFRRRFGYPDRW